MEWREQSNVSCDAAFLETQRWVQAVTKKTFGRNNFRSALENGVLLCDLINRIEPGIIKRVNRLSTPIAGLDNINVFLKACGKLGLKEAQLFHPGDLQDTSTRVTVKHQETSRRLKNVLITLYWLGRKTQSDPFFDGPNLNLNAFEGLLGITALAKALEESPVRRASSGSIRERDSGFGESWCSDREKEDIFPSLRGVHRRENSFDSLESLGSRPHSRSSDNTLKGSSEGCGSDAEADSDFRMAGDSSKDSLHYRRSLVIAPKTAAQFNQFLPTRDKPAAYVPAPLRKKRAERNEENRRSWASPMFTEEDGAFTSSDGPEIQMCSPMHPMGTVRADHHRPLSTDSLLQQMYNDSDDEEDDVGYADPVQDDLYTRKVGMTPKVPVDVSYDRFLPKFWTPEEDAHVQKIKLGSQRRPWYKKIQGFSRKKSGGSSSDESDCDISPWLSSAPPPSGPSPSSHPHAPEGPSYTSHPAASQSPHNTQPPHTAPCYVLKQHITNIPYFELSPVVFPPVDPTSGPRLIRCKKHHLLGRENPLDPPDPLEESLASIFPDLENDDMFARRTQAFYSNWDLAMLKTRVCNSNRWSEQHSSSDLQLNIITQPQGPVKGERTVLPDIELDDYAFRKVKPPQDNQGPNPVLGAADSYSPMLIPEPWALPAILQTLLLCPPSPLTKEEKTEVMHNREKRDDCEHPKTDDMLSRKFGLTHAVGAGAVHIHSQGSYPGRSASQNGPSVPTSCSDSDLQRMVAIREASRLRHKKRMMIERLAFLNS